MKKAIVGSMIAIIGGATAASADTVYSVAGLKNIDTSAFDGWNNACLLTEGGVNYISNINAFDRAVRPGYFLAGHRSGVEAPAYYVTVPAKSVRISGVSFYDVKRDVVANGSHRAGTEVTRLDGKTETATVGSSVDVVGQNTTDTTMLGSPGRQAIYVAVPTNDGTQFAAFSLPLCNPPADGNPTTPPPPGGTKE